MVQVDLPKTKGRWRFRWKFSALGWRFVATMLSVCAVFALVATLLQIWTRIQSETNMYASAANQIAQRLAPEIAMALAENRREDLFTAMHHVLSLNVVHSARIVEADRVAQHFNPDFIDYQRHEVEEFPLFHNTREFGKIQVVWQPRSAATDLISLTKRFLLMNLLESMVVGMIMLLLFDQIAARHLKKIADQVRSTPWTDTENPRWLEQGSGIFPDQIDSIVHALDYMRNEAKKAYSSLRVQAKTTSDLNASLQEANREQAELTYALSHDLITPVNTLDMLLQEVLANATNLETDTRDCLRDMRQSTRRMRQQIESVQTYAHLLQGPLRSERVDLNDVVAKSVAALADTIESAAADLHLEPLGAVRGDPGSLREMITQVLRNALLYRDHERDLSISITPQTNEAVGMVTFRIRDTGLGMQPDHCDDVFGLFRRLHTHAEIPGNGMGLPLARRIVDRHGGRIVIHSRPNEGTDVTISLPGYPE